MNIQDAKATISSIPKTRLYLYSALILFVSIYLIWSLFFQPKPVPTQTFTTPPPAVKAKKVDGPTVKLKVVPKKAVKDKFPELPIEDDEEVTDTADTKPLPNGGTVIVTTNTVTGETTTHVEAKKAPWFAPESNNYAGVGYQLHTGGETTLKGYYKRDLVRIKDLHLQGEVEVRIGKQVEGIVGVNLEYRW